MRAALGKLSGNSTVCPSFSSTDKLFSRKIFFNRSLDCRLSANISLIPAPSKMLQNLICKYRCSQGLPSSLAAREEGCEESEP